MFKQTIIICFCDFKAENYVTNENLAAFSVKDINMNYKHTIVFFVASFPIYTGKKRCLRDISKQQNLAKRSKKVAACLRCTSNDKVPWIQKSVGVSLISLITHVRKIILAVKREYRIYPDTSTPYHICSKIWTSTIYYPMLYLKTAGWVANSVDPDETPRSAASHLGLYCLLSPVCPNTYDKYGT